MSSLHLAGEGAGCLLPSELFPPSQYLRKGTFEEEASLWRQFLDNKVLLSFGKAFECKEPGWFRVVFSDKENRLCLGEQSPSPTFLCTASSGTPASDPSRPHADSSSLLLRDAKDAAGAREAISNDRRCLTLSQSGAT